MRFRTAAASPSRRHPVTVTSFAFDPTAATACAEHGGDPSLRRPHRRRRASRPDARRHAHHVEMGFPPLALNSKY
jgi:hypothetical protein